MSACKRGWGLRRKIPACAGMTTDGAGMTTGEAQRLNQSTTGACYNSSPRTISADDTAK